MAITAELFDGTRLEFPDDTDPSVIQETAKRLTLERQKALEPKKSEGILAAAQRGFESGLSSGRTGLESMFGSPEEAAAAAAKRQEDIQRRLGPEESRLEKVKKAYTEKGILPAASTLVGEIPGAIAEQAPNILATLAGAKTGALLATPIAAVSGPAAPFVEAGGALLGAFAPSYLQQFGGNIERQAQVQQEAGKPVSIDTSKAALTAVPQAGLDVASTFIPFGGKIAGKVFGPQVEKLLVSGGTKEAEKLAQESLLKTLTMGTAKTSLMEIPTEVSQQMLERYQAGLSLTSPEALKEYGETAFDVGLLGPLGILGRVSDKSQARQQLLEAQQKAQETNESQAVPLQLTYNGKQSVSTYIVHPDGSVSTSEEEAFNQRYKNQPVKPPETPVYQLGYDPTAGQIPFHVFPDGSIATSDDEAFKKMYSPQQIEHIRQEALRLGYDKTAGQTPFYVMPDGSVASSQDMLLAQKYKPQPMFPPGKNEAYASEADRLAVEKARWEEARKNSPAMQELNRIAAEAEKRRAAAIAKVDADETAASEFAKNAPVGGVFRAPTQEEIDAKKQKAANKAYSSYIPVGILGKDGIKVFAGELIRGDKFIRYRNEDNKFRTHSVKAENVIVNPTEQDILKAETKTLEKEQAGLEKTQASLRGSNQETTDKFKKFLRKNPIEDKYADDILDDIKRVLNPSKTAYRPLSKTASKGFFTEGGNNLDELASMAHDQGFISDEEFNNPNDTGGVKAFMDKVNQVHKGKYIESNLNADKLAELGQSANVSDAIQKEIDARQEALTQKPTAEDIAAEQNAGFQQYMNENIDLFKQDLADLQSQYGDLEQFDYTKADGSPGNRAIDDIMYRRMQEYLRNTEAQREVSSKAEREINPTDKFFAEGEALIKDMRKRLDKMGLHNVALKLEEVLTELRDGKLSDISGRYTAFRKLIEVSLSSTNPMRSLHHEALHAMKELGMFSPKEWAMLEDKARSTWMKKYNIAEVYKDLSEVDQLEEAIAKAFGDYGSQSTPIKAIIARVVNFFRAFAGAFKGHGFNSAEDVFRRAAAGKLKGKGVGRESANARAERGMINTLTDAFRRWFGDSKVVNEDGTPKIMYHGTPEAFEGNEFKLTPTRNRAGNPEGYYFTDYIGEAESYAESSEDKAIGQAEGYVPSKEYATRMINFGEGAQILPVYLSIKNPFVKGSRVTPEMVRVLEEEIIKDNPQLGSRAKEYARDKAEIMKERGDAGRSYAPGIFPNISFPPAAMKRVLQAGGYDGFQDGRHWIAFEPNQIKSAIGNRGTYSQESADIRYERDSFAGMSKESQDRINKYFGKPAPKTWGEKYKEWKPKFFDRIIQGAFDEFRAIKNLDERSYMLARMSKSIDGALEGLLFHGEVKLRDDALEIKSGTKGLIELYKELGGDVERYQIWKALNRDAKLPEDKRSFKGLHGDINELSKGKIGDKSRLEVYNRILREENKLNKSVLDVAKAKGLIDDEAYQSFSNDIYYIPFYKYIEENGGDVNAVQNSSRLTNQYFSKALKGGEKRVGDLMENMLLNWSHILSASMKNGAAVSTLKAGEKLKAVTRVKSTYEGKDVVKVMENGKQAYYSVADPFLLDSISLISYMGPKSPFLDLSKSFTNMLRYGVTLSPAYKVRNLIRDSIQSAAISPLSLNIFNNVVDGFKLSHNKHPTFVSALAGGGVFELGVAHEGDQAALIKRLVKMGVDESTILDNPEKIKSGLKRMLEKYNELGNKFENANRLALYQKLINEGKDHLYASFMARDLMDFSLQGSWRAFKVVSQVVPFFNARLQGLYKLGRDGVTPTSRVIYNTLTGKEIDASDKVKATSFGVITSSVILASMLLYSAFKDDEDFKRREDWDRDNFWWFKIGGEIFRIPKPFEIGAFGTIAERSLEQVMDDSVEGKVFAKRLHSILMDNFSMNPTPQIIKPMIDIYSNKDSFSQAPIETAGMERLSKQERVTNNTSELAKALGGISEMGAKVLSFNPQAEGFSPVQIDYAIKAYFGWLGGFVAYTSDQAVKPWSDVEKPGKTLADAIGISSFVKEAPETQSKYMADFYESNTRINQALADMKRYAELGEYDKLSKIMEEKGDDIALQKIYSQVSDQLAIYRKYINIVTNDKTMSREDKDNEIKRMRVLMSDAAKQVEEIRVSLKKQK